MQFSEYLSLKEKVVGHTESWRTVFTAHIRELELAVLQEFPLKQFCDLNTNGDISQLQMVAKF